VLQSAVGEWFEQDGDVPFMMQVYQIREAKRPLIPAVAHVDGSGRLQTVYAHTNPRYHALIMAFFEQTGVPMVLNTSSTRTNPWSAPPPRRWTAFCAPRWMCW
jgi:carbamoyltransferase